MRRIQLKTIGVSVVLAGVLSLGLMSPGSVVAGQEKAMVCHRPPGNPENFHTISISENALDAHLAHGDLMGSCSEHLDELCSDGNPCTQDYDMTTEQCLSTPPPVNCNDNNPCTNDYCDSTSGCVNWEAWAGNSCDIDIDHCELNPCANGDCLQNPASVDVAPGYVCFCFPGWTGTNCDEPAQ